jgi:hypothetical protein
MSAHLATVHVLPTGRSLEGEETSSPAELASARYADREINDALAIAGLCNTASAHATALGKRLIAGVLSDFDREFTDEAALLAPTLLPDVHWPRRALWQVESDAELDDWISTIHDALQHSARTLRWIASRPDLTPLAQVTFNALASARHTRQRLLLVCSAVDR